MRLKLFFSLLFILVISQSSYAKIETIKDEFYGTEYYKTDSVNINYTKAGFDYWAQFRFRTANGDKDIIIMDIAVIYVAHHVFVLEKALVRCANEHIISFEPDDIISKISSEGKNFTFVGSLMPAVRCSIILGKKDIEAIKSQATVLRLMLQDSYKNITISKSEAAKINKALEELEKKQKEIE